MSYIFHAEEQKIRRVANGLLEKYSITPVDNEAPKKIGQRYLKSKSIEKSSLYTNKTMHGYIDRQLEKDTNIDHKVSKSWTRNRFMKSDFEAYAFAIKEQEISTNFIKAKRAKDNMNITLDSKCRLCKTATEDIIHIISSCPLMSARYYLPIRHDVIAKLLYNKLIMMKNPSFQRSVFETPEYIYKDGNVEYWWNVSVKTITKLKNNKPDVIIWDRDKRECNIIEFSCPADNNVSRKVEEKITIYGPLVRNLQIMYNDYTFKMLPIIVGALGTIPKATRESLIKLGFPKRDINRIIRKMQEQVIKGTVQICKTFMRFSE